MKCFNGSKKDNRVEDRAERGGVRASGVRARGAPAADEGPPCASFEEAYGRFGRPISMWILGKLGGDESAEDVLQTVWVALDRCIQQERGVPYPLLPVLYRFARNALHDHVRAEKRRREDEAPDSSVPASRPDPEQLLADAEGRTALKERVEAVFEQMSQDEVDLIRLAHLADEALALKDVAESAGIAEATLRVRLHRARKRFGKLYRHIYGSSAAREDDPLSTAPRKSVPLVRARSVVVTATTTSPEGASLTILNGRRGSVLASCTAESGAQGYLFQWGSHPAHPEAWASPVFSKGHTFELHNQAIGQMLYLRIAIVRRGSIQSQWTQALQVLVR